MLKDSAAWRICGILWDSDQYSECIEMGKMNRHELDPYPIPKEKNPLFINEPWIIDKSLLEYPVHPEPEDEEDNVRVYVPVDLNRKAILRRIDRIISQFGEANEENESEYSVEVNLTCIIHRMNQWRRKAA